MVDRVDIVNEVDRVDMVDKVDRVHTIDRVDRVDTVDKVDRVHTIELSLAKPGGGKASPRGEASRESVLPTSLLACPSGGWALSLLEVRIVGSVQVYDIKGSQYTVVKKTYLL